MKKLMHIALALALALALPGAAIADEADEGRTGSEGSGAESASTAAGAANATGAAEAKQFTILAGETDIEKLTDSYENARADLEALDSKIADLQGEIDSIEAELPAQQARSDAGIKQRYIMQSNPLVIVEALLSVGTFGDFLKETDYLEKISRENLREYNRLCDMRERLDQARGEQERLREETNARMTEAESSLRAVQDMRARKQAEDQALAVSQAEMLGGENSVEKEENGSSSSSSDKKSSSKSTSSKKSEKDKKAEAAAKAAEEEAKAKKAAEDAAKGILPPVEATTDTTGLFDGADWHADRDVFIDDWAARIDAYLAGSPLEGQGRNFASAAWKYGIDPRWSPAISNIESSKGAICIRPFNAWGWGAADSDPYGLALEWGSWEEAIDAHVKGLAEGYGYTVSMGRARTYCPPNWQRWYNSVVESMASMAGKGE